MKAKHGTNVAQDSSLRVPIRCGAKVPHLENIRMFGNWILARAAEDEQGLPYTWDFEFLGSGDEAHALLEEALRLPSRPVAELLGFLRSYGLFSKAHWVPAERLLRAPVRKEVKDFVRTLKQETIYSVRIQRLKDDLILLGCVAELAGALNNERWSQISPIVERARKLMSRHKPVPGSLVGDALDTPELAVTPDALQVLEERQLGDEGDGASQPGVTRQGTRPKKALREDANSVIDNVLRQVLSEIQVKFAGPSAEHGPGLRLEAGSMEGVLGLMLISEFHRDWRRCARPDCSNIFASKQRRDRQYCSHSCAHLEGVRRVRKQTRESGKRGN